jgi:hypothetical protein
MEKTKTGPRLFTLTEAQKMLPLVRSIVRDVVDRYGTFKERLEFYRLAQEARKDGVPPPDGYNKDRLKDEIERLKDQVMSVVGELTSLGVELRDYEEGMVDFPARLGEDIVYLSWKVGESKIGYWRPLDGGDGPRRALEEIPEGAGGGGTLV